jgi:hypothetical protein
MFHTTNIRILCWTSSIVNIRVHDVLENASASVIRHKGREDVALSWAR